MASLHPRKNVIVLIGVLVLILIPFSFAIYSTDAAASLTVKELAKKHSIYYNKPAPDFFEGALLGNGAMGVVVTTRPDAIVFYFGHNNVWDIRVAEDHKEEIGDFNYVFNKVKSIPSTYAKLTHDKWYKEYHRLVSENYSKPYPRPFGCGSVVLSFDRRKVELLGHSLDISNGLCTIKLLTTEKKKIFLKVITDMKDDKLLMQLVDASGTAARNVFERIKIIPDPSTPKEFPAYKVTEPLAEGALVYRQVLPAKADEIWKPNPKDKAVLLTLKVNNSLSKTRRINVNGGFDEMGKLEAAISSAGTFSAIVSLKEGLNSEVAQNLSEAGSPSYDLFTSTLSKNIASWDRFWSKSSVELSDNFLEQTWYRNLYFFNCAAKDGVSCPGLFANWSYNNIGSSWHGDYHFNYNIQQPFWATFSSNHLEKNLPYVNLVESLLPLSKKWAREYYKMPGASFVHTAYPAEMSMSPYPIPDWGWEISETPWAVQGLWWHYLYSGDKEFLRSRAYEPIKAAVQFLTAYMFRPDAHGRGKWNDDKYHIFPTVPPELHGLVPGFKFNYDCSIDLALTKFIFKAFQQSTAILQTADNERALLDDIEKILQNYPEYPVTNTKEYGEIYAAAPGESGEEVFNIPLSLAAVFPGEDYGLDSDLSTLRKLKNTYRNHQNEGGNDLVFLNMQAARIGMLDLEQFKRQVNYCLLPNGTATNLVSQTAGRYNDQSDFSFMAKSGIWFENFALPAVINECLMQGYNGTIQLFPNWPREKDAAFNNLRAAGAFLVSASQKDGEVKAVKILSEKGNELRIKVPWGARGYILTPSGKREIKDDIVLLKTSPGEIITFIQ